jgi:hypothetical protein
MIDENVDKSCDKCLALTGSGLCDLGRKALYGKGTKEGLMSLDISCIISNSDEYIAAHLLKI